MPPPDAPVADLYPVAGPAPGRKDASLSTQPDYGRSLPALPARQCRLAPGGGDRVMLRTAAFTSCRPGATLASGGLDRYRPASIDSADLDSSTSLEEHLHVRADSDPCRHGRRRSCRRFCTPTSPSRTHLVHGVGRGKSRGLRQWRAGGELVVSRLGRRSSFHLRNARVPSHHALADGSPSSQTGMVLNGGALHRVGGSKPHSASDVGVGGKTVALAERSRRPMSTTPLR